MDYYDCIFTLHAYIHTTTLKTQVYIDKRSRITYKRKKEVVWGVLSSPSADHIRSLYLHAAFLQGIVPGVDSKRTRALRQLDIWV